MSSSQHVCTYIADICFPCPQSLLYRDEGWLQHYLQLYFSLCCDKRYPHHPCKTSSDLPMSKLFCSGVSLWTTPAHPTVVLSCSFAWLTTFMRMFLPQQLPMTSKKASRKASKKASRAVTKRYLQWLHHEVTKLSSTLSCPPMRGDPEVQVLWRCLLLPYTEDSPSVCSHSPCLSSAAVSCGQWRHTEPLRCLASKFKAASLYCDFQQ